MDQRRYKQQTLLANLRQKRRDLTQMARLHLDTIESATFVVDDPLLLDGRTIEVASVELHKVLKEAAGLQGRIDELEEALGL